MKINQIAKTLGILFILFGCLFFQSCKQKQSITQAKYKDLEKIPVTSAPSVYSKHEGLSANTSSNMAENKATDAETSNTNSFKQDISESAIKTGEILKNQITHKNTAEKKQPFSQLKQKVERSRMMMKHIKQIKELKRAIEKQNPHSDDELLIFLLILLIILLIVVIAGLNLLLLLLVLLLALLFYLLLMS